MSTPEYLSLFSLEGEFSVETPGVPVALRRVSGGALADLMKSPPCALSFDEYRHEVLRYEVDPANKVLRIHVRMYANLPTQWTETVCFTTGIWSWCAQRWMSLGLSPRPLRT